MLKIIDGLRLHRSAWTSGRIRAKSFGFVLSPFGDRVSSYSEVGFETSRWPIADLSGSENARGVWARAFFPARFLGGLGLATAPGYPTW